MPLLFRRGILATSALSAILKHSVDVLGVYTPELQSLRCHTRLQCLGDGAVHDAHGPPDLVRVRYGRQIFTTSKV
jgi:hypothetical protein